MDKKVLRYVGIGVAAVVLIIVMFCSLYVIDAGFSGVKSTFGNVEEKTYQSGLGFKLPWTKVIEFDVRTKKIAGTTTSYTSDMQTAQIAYNLTYNLRNDNIHQLYKTVGTDYEAKKIIPILNDVLKNDIGKWQAQELVANRDSARRQINGLLQARMDERYFENITFQLDSIDYSDNFEKAIERKVIAEQDAQTSKNNTVRIQEEAQQKVISAQAEAEAMKIKAEALAKNPALIQYEATLRWNGELPETMLGNGSVPMIQLPIGK